MKGFHKWENIGHKLKFAFLLFVLGYFSPDLIFSKESINFDFIPVQSSGFVRDVALKDKYAFIAGYKNGLQVFDLVQHKIIHTDENVKTAYSVTIDGRILYVANRKFGIVMFDIKFPGHPKKIGTFNTEGNAMDLVVLDSIAYIADGSFGMQIVDCRIPSKPVLIGNYDTEGYANSVVIENSIAYIADGSNGISIVDISNASNPKSISNIKTKGYVKSSIVNQNSLYIASGSEGLVVYDISSPLNPVLTSVLKTGGDAQAIELDSSKNIFLADGFLGVHVIEIKDHPKPKILRTIPLGDIANNITHYNGKMMVCNSYMGFLFQDNLY